MPKLLLLLPLLFCFSCKHIMQRKMNKQNKFHNRTELMAFMEKKLHFPPSHILYVDDASMFDFAGELQSKNISIYYGTLLNDSAVIKTSAQLNENPSCYGNILSEIKLPAQQAVNNNIPVVPVETEPSRFKSYKIKYANSDAPFDMNVLDKKYKLLLVYGSGTGNYYNDTYKDIIAYQQLNNAYIDLYIISIDMNLLPR